VNKADTIDMNPVIIDFDRPMSKVDIDFNILCAPLANPLTISLNDNLVPFNNFKKTHVCATIDCIGLTTLLKSKACPIYLIPGKVIEPILPNDTIDYLISLATEPTPAMVD